MMQRINRRRGQKGFTLIELLIVVAIIGIIAAMLIPNLIEALQKAKQKRTMSDARNVGSALFHWYTDQVGAAAAGQITFSTVDFSAMVHHDQAFMQVLLVDGGPGGGILPPGTLPQYIQSVPERDGWGSLFDYGIALNLLDDTVLGIRSPGQPQPGANDGVFEGNVYQSGAYLAFNTDCDIVWIDGEFVHYPAGKKFVDAQGAEAGPTPCA